jgi:hypothetical protein
VYAPVLDVGTPLLVELAAQIGLTGFGCQHWRRDAACRGVDPAIFMPERGGSADEARTYCRRCSVQRECLEYALNLEQKECMGVWGASTGRDRRRARKRGWDATELLERLE